jgi:hypothetical protein
LFWLFVSAGFFLDEFENKFPISKKKNFLKRYDFLVFY